MSKKIKLSVISAMHYFKLVYRSLLFLGALTYWLIGKFNNVESPFDDVEHKPVILIVIWIVFAVEMVLRFFPSKTESMGCQKQFKKNLIPTGETHPKRMSGKRTFAVALVWIVLNAIIGALYRFGVYDSGVLLLVSLLFAVCDMICILFFCPFQTWFMKNKCCTTCRIFNWDHLMMFLPIISVNSFFSWSLVLFAFAIWLVWEICVFTYPERFWENSNMALKCSECTDKLCTQYCRKLRK